MEHEEDFINRMLRKIDNREKLNPSELWTLIWEYSYEEIDGEHHRWTQSMTSIVELDGRYFSIWWERGLTENQENEVYYQLPREVKQVTKTKTITVTEWVDI